MRISLNSPNQNDRVYDKLSFVELPKKVPVFLGMRGESDASPAIGEASNFVFKGDALMADIVLNPGVDFEGMAFVPTSAGRIDHPEDPLTKQLDASVDRVRDAAILAVCMIPKASSAFESERTSAADLGGHLA